MLNLKTHHREALSRRSSGFRNATAVTCFVSLLLMSSNALQAAEPNPEITGVTYAVGNGLGARIVNGQPTTWYPSVGALLYGNGNVFGNWCTATLIGCNTVLTAAHCVADDGDVRNYRMFFQHGGMVKVKSIDWQKQDYREPTTKGEQADIAVITLAETISGIAPHPINEDREHEPNVPGTIVGFGRTGGAATDYGLKRFGAVTSADCGAGFAKNEMVCWDFNGRDSNTCNGDSGGPLLLSENRPEQVISGVTSGGRNPTCLSSDHSFDTSVFRYSKWVKSVAGADLGTKACGPAVPIANNAKRYKPFSGQLSLARPLHVFEVRVKGAQVLRVGVNVAKFEGDVQETAAQPQFFIAKGTDRDKTKALCTSDPAEAAAAFCSVPNPEDGQIYSVVLERAGGQGRAEFQLVVSVF
jgi:Trypsin